jgi:hypothetical protein
MVQRQRVTSLFIASSGTDAGREAAKRIKAELEAVKGLRPLAWWEMEAFPIGEFTFESLTKVSHKCQAAIVVLTPDDKVTKKGAAAFVARDNALFEAGLFMSAFGRYRVAIARSKAVSVLSDIHGITRLEFAAKPTDEELSALRRWAKGLHNPRLPKLVFNCAEDSIRNAARPPITDLHEESISFPYEAYPRFLARLLEDERIKIRAVEAISVDQVEYFRALPSLGRYAAPQYRNFHWFLWSSPDASSLLDDEKTATLLATKRHPGVSRTIVVPRAVPKLLHDALLLYADQMRGGNSTLRFALVSKPIPEERNQMSLSMGGQIFRAHRLVDTGTGARTVCFEKTGEIPSVLRGRTIDLKQLPDELEVMRD